MSFKQFNEHETHHFTYKLIFKPRTLVSYLLKKTDIRLLYCRLPTPQFHGSHCNPDLELRIILSIYYRLAEGPNVARGKKSNFVAYLPISDHKKCQPIRSSRLAGYMEHIYMTVLFYYR